jgi:hypothetical protein
MNLNLKTLNPSMLLIFLTLNIAFSSCSDKRKTQKSATHGQISLINKLESDTTNVPSEYLFDSIEYIPLETKKNSLFARVDQLEITKEHYYILDKLGSSILKFDKKGKFCFRIKSSGISSFLLDDKSERIIFLDNHLSKFYVYNLDGKLINSGPRKFEFSSAIALPSGNFAFYRYYSHSDEEKQNKELYNLIITDTAFNFKSQYMGYSPKAIGYNELYTPKSTFFRSQSEIFYINPGTYTVYQVAEDKPVPAFEIELDEKYALPEGFTRDENMYGKRMDYLSRNNSKVFYIDYFYKLDNVVFFKLTGMNVEFNCLYQLDNEKVLSLDNIVFGEQSHFLPIGDEVLGVDQDAIYRSESAEVLFNYKKKQGDSFDIHGVTDQLKEFFLRQNNLSNPVLIKIKPKKINLTNIFKP